MSKEIISEKEAEKLYQEMLRQCYKKNIQGDNEMKAFYPHF